MRRTRLTRARTGVVAGLLVALFCLAADARPASSHSPATAPPHPCLVVTGAGDTPFVRNFNPFAPIPLSFTWGGIYEPLVVVTNSGHRYNWLASKFSWDKERTTLTLTVRHGVQWSDGRPLTNRDVLYTLTAGRQDKDMDQIGLTRRGNDVASISLVGSDKVAIHLKARLSTFVTSILANNLFVVPQHVFAHVRHASAWQQPNPVGSGPFASVLRFGDQAYVLGRNPHYWLKGAPHFPCIERVLGSSGESALFAMLKGEVDLTNNFYPNAQQAYVAHDPEHFHFFYPANSLPIGLFLDDTKYPYSLVAFRMAISRAIDRNTISQLAEYGYSRPVDAIGIDRIWGQWLDPDVIAEAKRLASYDPAAAKRTLLAAGFTYTNGVLLDPRGDPVVIKAVSVAGWPDWVAAWNMITRNLAAVGIKIDLTLAPTMDAWMPDAFSTRAATLLWTSGSTPYAYFTQHLDRASFVPSGKDAGRTGDWEHFQSAEGTRLLRALRRTVDLAEQRALATKLERLWLETLPFVPLFSGPVWSTYSTKHFLGFPDARNFYLDPGFFTPNYVVALTRIRPA